MIEISFTMMVCIAIYLYVMGIIILLVFGDLQFESTVIGLIFDAIVILLYPITIPLLWLYDVISTFCSDFVRWLRYINGKFISMNDVDD